MTFENYLQDIHAMNYMGNDDDMPEAFENWLSNLDTEELMNYADNAMTQHMSMSELKYKNMILKRKNPTKTFIGGIVCTLIVIYIIFPLADYLTDTLLAYLMK